MKIELAIGIIIIVVWFLFLAGTKITLHPFSISIVYWERALGYVLIGLGTAFLSVGEYHRGKIKGHEEGVDKCIELLDKKIQEDEK